MHSFSIACNICIYLYLYGKYISNNLTLYDIISINYNKDVEWIG